MSASPRAKARRLAVTAFTLVALTSFTAGTATAAVSQFSNPAPITVPATGDVGVADLYPSPIVVSGLTGTVSKVTVTLHNVNQDQATQDLDVLLVAPDGKTVILMSDAGGVNTATNVTLTFDDAAVDSLTTAALASGTFKPTNLDDGDPAGADVFDSPAPTGPYGATLAALNGGPPNGTWQLFVLDDATTGTGSIANGWTLTLTTKTNFIAVGAGAGGGPHVRLMDAATGTEIVGFFAYDPAFTGGVRVAAGDVNGDGISDVITSPGPGGGPHVRVLDGATLLAGGGPVDLLSFFAYDAGFSGGVFVASADVNNDGKADIITSPGAGGGPHVRAFSGVDGSEIIGLFGFDPAFTGGVFVGGGSF